VVSGTSLAGAPRDGCAAHSGEGEAGGGAAEGRAVLVVYRGGCGFHQKALLAQQVCTSSAYK
jgi:hypothetical protein